MQDLGKLTSRDLSEICLQAEEICGRRFARIAVSSDPSDEPLQELLVDMAAGAQLQIDALRRREKDLELRSEAGLGAVEIRDLVLRSFSSLTLRFGEGRIPRDTALFYAETVEEELSRFFAFLADHAGEFRARELCFELAEREHGKALFLREVLLKD